LQRLRVLPIDARKSACWRIAVVRCWTGTPSAWQKSDTWCPGHHHHDCSSLASSGTQHDRTGSVWVLARRIEASRGIALWKSNLVAWCPGHRLFAIAISRLIGIALNIAKLRVVQSRYRRRIPMAPQRFTVDDNDDHGTYARDRVRRRERNVAIVDGGAVHGPNRCADFEEGVCDGVRS